MSYTNTSSLGFEEAERSPLVLVDIRMLKSILSDIVRQAIQTVSPTGKGKTEEIQISPEDTLMDMEETLKFLKVSKVTIHNWKKGGIIKSHKMGRKLYFKKVELLDALKRQKYSLIV